MLTIIGCGNSNRRDDGVGVYAVQKLQGIADHNSWRNVSIFDAGTAGMEVMFKAKGCDALIIIDANKSQSRPGTIFEVPGKDLINIPEPGYNLHDFRWDHALYAGEKIFKDSFPKNVTVFLIEVADLDLGTGLSKDIQKAADRVCVLVEEKYKTYVLAKK